MEGSLPTIVVGKPDYGVLGSAKYFGLTSRKLVRKAAQDGHTQKLPRAAVKKNLCIFSCRARAL